MDTLSLLVQCEKKLGVMLEILGKSATGPTKPTSETTFISEPVRAAATALLAASLYPDSRTVHACVPLFFFLSLFTLQVFHSNNVRVRPPGAGIKLDALPSTRSASSTSDVRAVLAQGLASLRRGCLLCQSL